MTQEEKRKPPYVLDSDEFKLVKSLCETIVPSGADGSSEPGAREVGAENYFDSVLLEMPSNQQVAIKDTLALIQKEAMNISRGRAFHDLSLQEKKKLFDKLLSDPKTRLRLNDLRSLCLAGFYSDYHDPDYKGKTAWDWLEFGGRRISELKKDWSFLRIYRDARLK